jgi:hypothetical protein
VAGQRRHVNGLANQLVEVIVGECRHVDASAAAHGREKRDFVAGADRRIPGGEFLVARSDNRGAVFCELRMARGVESEELLDRRGVCELECSAWPVSSLRRPKKRTVTRIVCETGGTGEL